MTSIIKVDNIQNSGGTAALSIDSTGRVFEPAKPFIQLFRNVNASYSQDSIITGFRVNDSRGITYNDTTGIITVPVGGLYMIGFHAIQSTTAGIMLMIEGTDIYRISYAAAASGEAWSKAGGDGLFRLNANDEIKFKAVNSTVTLYGDTSTITVGGAYVYLVG